VTATAFLTVSFVHLLAAISPGPSFVLALRTSATDGFRTATALALGYGVAAATMAAAALLGLSVLFAAMPWLFGGLKLVGGLFLIYIAIVMWRHAPEPLATIDADTKPRSLRSAFGLGVVTMLSNPKGIVFFGAVFAGLLPLGATLGDKIIVVAAVFVVETLWYFLVAWAFSTAPARAAYTRWKTTLDRSLGAVLGVLGARIALP